LTNRLVEIVERLVDLARGESRAPDGRAVVLLQRQQERLGLEDAMAELVVRLAGLPDDRGANEERPDPAGELGVALDRIVGGVYRLLRLVDGRRVAADLRAKPDPDEDGRDRPCEHERQCYEQRCPLGQRQPWLSSSTSVATAATAPQIRTSFSTGRRYGLDSRSTNVCPT
jgi:hypothetical protein